MAKIIKTNLDEVCMKVGDIVYILIDIPQKTSLAIGIIIGRMGDVCKVLILLSYDEGYKENTIRVVPVNELDLLRGSITISN